MISEPCTQVIPTFRVYVEAMRQKQTIERFSSINVAAASSSRKISDTLSISNDRMQVGCFTKPVNSKRLYVGPFKIKVNLNDGVMNTSENNLLK